MIFLRSFKRRKYSIAFAILLGVFFASLGVVWADQLTPKAIYESNHGVYYQIFVRAFADGSGDGLEICGDH